MIPEVVCPVQPAAAVVVVDAHNLYALVKTCQTHGPRYHGPDAAVPKYH